MRFRRLIHLFLACMLSILLAGCGGGEPEPVAATGTAPASTPSPQAPSAPGTSSGTPQFQAAPSFSSTPPNASTSSTSRATATAETPDGVVKQMLTAVENNEFELIWDLLPASYQTQINELFQDFGKQVDSELWDQSFNLANRYLSTMISKEEMFYATPEIQAQLTSAKTMASLAGPGVGDLEWLTQEKLKKLTKPMNDITIRLINSEISSSKKLKAFDGRDFFADTISPVVENLRKFVELIIEEASQVEELKGNAQVQMMLQQADIKKFFDNIEVNVKDEQEDSAVVEITAMGQPTEITMTKVEGKWIPQSLASMFGLGIGMAKAQVPMIAQQVNSTKDRVMPALDEIEVLIKDLQQAKTQAEFNVAYSAFNAEAPQILSKAMGMPGLGSMLGAGSVEVQPIKILVESEVTDERLSLLIAKLEGLTESPEQAISLPKREGSRLVIEMTPVSNPLEFAHLIGQESTLVSSSNYDAARDMIVLTLKEVPADETTPASETSDP